MNRSSVLVAALGLMIATPAASAELPPVHVTFGYGAQVVTDRAYDFVDDDDHLPMFRVGAGYSFLLPPGTLDAELTYRTGGTDEFAHQNLRSALWFRGVELSGTYRYPWTRVFQPYGRVAAGWDWATLDVNGDALRQTTSTIAGTAMLGMQARLPIKVLRDAGALVLDVGAGYTFRPAFEFDELRPDPQGKPVADAIPSGSVNLGALPMSGISYGISLGFSL